MEIGNGNSNLKTRIYKKCIYTALLTIYSFLISKKINIYIYNSNLRVEIGVVIGQNPEFPLFH